MTAEGLERDAGVRVSSDRNQPASAKVAPEFLPGHHFRRR